MKSVKEVMVTTPKFCQKTESLQTVAEEMTRSSIGSLPVVDENRKLVGVITDRDICLAAGSTKKDLSSVKVHEVLGKNPVHTISPNDDLSSALRIMRLKKVGRLPVVDQEKRLQGVISLNHIVRRTYGSADEAEIEWEGDENVIKTLHALSSRNVEVAY